MTATYTGHGATGTLTEILSALDAITTETPAYRPPRLVEVTQVHADRSIRAFVDGTLQDVSLATLERWMQAAVTIQPWGGWQ